MGGLDKVGLRRNYERGRFNKFGYEILLFGRSK